MFQRSMVFEGIAKTNTTNTFKLVIIVITLFEGIAKTNTTNTQKLGNNQYAGLRVLLKQIQQTLSSFTIYNNISLRVLLKQIQQTPRSWEIINMLV